MRVTGAAENKSIDPILFIISGKSPERSTITNVEKRKTSQALFPFLIILVKEVNPTKKYTVKQIQSSEDRQYTCTTENKK